MTKDMASAVDVDAVSAGAVQDDAKRRDTSGGGEDETIDVQLEDEARLERIFAEREASKGLDHDDTLAVFFELFDTWIGLYRLNKCEEPMLTPTNRNTE